LNVVTVANDVNQSKVLIAVTLPSGTHAQNDPPITPSLPDARGGFSTSIKTT